MPTLTWIGKEAVENHHNQVPFRLLKRNNKLSFGEADSGNLLVQGDNLEALKALLPYYAGQVKCIYIDPPYNTGNENWVYNDNVNSPEIKSWLGNVVGPEAEDLSRHDKWLCMMYPRLCLLKQFLKNDGVILVSIDDNEIDHLRVLMDSIFGRNNFIAQLVWDKTRKNDAKLFSVGHEYIVIYALSKSYLRKINTQWRESKPGADEIKEKYEELKKQYGDDYENIAKEIRSWYKSLDKKHPAKKYSRYKNVDEKGIWRDRDISWPGGGGPRYDVIHPVTKKPCLVPERGWGFATPESMQEQMDKGLIVFREDENTPPFRKAYLFESQEQVEDDIEADEEIIGSQVMPSIIYKQAQVSVKFLRNIFDGKKTFENPKDHEVLIRLFKYLTVPGDIILDSFAGSGSTGHAILQINQHTKIQRSFILVELEKEICQNITRERLLRAINGYSYKSKKGKVTVEGTGGGFVFTELKQSIFNANGEINTEVTFEELARHVYFCETGEPLLKTTRFSSPMLGVYKGVAIYLLYNGILKDKTVNGGNVLTSRILAELPKHEGKKVIYGTACKLSDKRLRTEQIIFKQTPYEIRIN